MASAGRPSAVVYVFWPVTRVIVPDWTVHKFRPLFAHSDKKQFDQIYPSLAATYNLPLIPFLLEGVAMRPEFNQGDGIHPNLEGTKKVSTLLEKKIIELFKLKTK